MAGAIDITETLNVKGQTYPLPVLKTKQAIAQLDGGDVLEVLATDSDSISNMARRVDGTDGVTLLEQAEVAISSNTTSRIARKHTRRATMQLGIIIERAEAERLWNAFRLASAALDADHTVESLLLGDDVEASEVETGR